jgi:hypothetical protein
MQAGNGGFIGGTAAVIGEASFGAGDAHLDSERLTLFTVKTGSPGAPVISEPEDGAVLPGVPPVLKGRGERDCRIEAWVNGNVYVALVRPNGSWELRIADSFPDGTHTVRVYQVDAMGNVGMHSDLTITIDSSIPIVPVITYPEQDGYVSSPDFTARGTGAPGAVLILNAAGAEYRTLVKSDGSWAADITGDGRLRDGCMYTISAKQSLKQSLAQSCEDCRLTTASACFRVDAKCLGAPEISYPLNDAFISTLNPVVTGTGKAGAFIELSVNRRRFTANVSDNGQWAVVLSKCLTIGKNTIQARQIDRGNFGPCQSVCFTVSILTPPKPSVIFPVAEQILDSGGLTIKGAGEKGAAIEIRLDEKSFKAVISDSGYWAFPVPYLLENGRHGLLVRQSDIAGNRSAFTDISFIVNGNQPEAQDAEPAAYRICYNPPGPEWTAKTIVTLKTDTPVTVGNVCGTCFSKIVSSNGVFHFSFSDATGSCGAISAAVTWTDDKLPVIQILTTGNYFLSDKVINCYKIGGSAIRYALLNGEPFESGKRVMTEGFYRIEVCDQAGNLEEEEFIIDRTPPSIMGVENRATYFGEVTVMYYDSLSGVKSAMLNGRNILSGARVTKAGDYTLTVTDYAGNASQRVFKIQK